MKLAHPDTAKSTLWSSRFLEIQEAYAILSDPVRRADYDRRRAADWAAASGPAAAAVASERPPTGAAAGAGAEDAATALDDDLDAFGPIHFGWRGGTASGGAAAGRPAAAAGRPAAAGGRPAVDGRPPGEDRTLLHLTLEEAFRGKDVLLGGVRVRIPPGARDGMIMRVPHVPAGGGAPSVTAGPALVEIKLRPHRRFTVRGDDLRLDLGVAAGVLVHGGQVSLDTPGGPLSVAVPPGLGPGRLLRLRGRGLPATPLRRAGDIIIRLVPAGRPSGEERR